MEVDYRTVPSLESGGDGLKGRAGRRSSSVLVDIGRASVLSIYVYQPRALVKDHSMLIQQFTFLDFNLNEAVEQMSKKPSEEDEGKQHEESCFSHQ